MTHSRRRTDRAGGDPVRLLVVDDDTVDRMSVERLLERTDLRVEVAEAAGVLEAIDRMTASPFDCVLLDYMLPDGDGLTFLRGMRGAGLSVPVVMLTGQSDPEVAASLVAAGAADYIPKGLLTAERLSESIRGALRKAG
jgi:CheY-like chemotaxis protein